MNAMHPLRVSAVSVTVLVLLGARTVVSAQSLAEVAKKEEERRKSTPQPAKVYTNKDLSPAPAGSTPPVPAAKDAKDTAAANDEAKDAKDGKGGDAKDGAGTKDQKYWSDKMKSLREQVGRDQGYADAMQTKINALTTDFINRDDPAQKRVIEADRVKALAELARLKKSVIDGTKAIADLQEEARRAGVPSGWLR